MPVLLGFVGFAILMTISALLGGWAISNLWEWFIVPTFNLKSLSIVQAIGLGMVVSYMSYTHVPSKEGESFSVMLTNGFAMAIFRPVFAVCFGWIIHQFM